MAHVQLVCFGGITCNSVRCKSPSPTNRCAVQFLAARTVFLPGIVARAGSPEYRVHIVAACILTTFAAFARHG